MSALIALIVFIGLPAVLARVFSIALATRAPHWRRRTRMAVAALGAGLLPVLPALIMVGRTYGTSYLVPFGAVLLLGLIVAVVVGLPSAWLAARRDVAGQAGPETFE